MGLLDGLLTIGAALLLSGGDTKKAGRQIENTAYQNKKGGYSYYERQARDMMKSSDPNVARQGKAMYEKAHAQKMELIKEHDQKEAQRKLQEQQEARQRYLDEHK